MTEYVTFEKNGHTLVASLRCELDHHTAKPIRTSIDARLFEERPDVLELDFSEVRFMDSSGIGLILGRAETAGARDCAVRLCGLSGELLRVVRLCGIEKMKNITIVPA